MFTIFAIIIPIVAGTIYIFLTYFEIDGKKNKYGVLNLCTILVRGLLGAYQYLIFKILVKLIFSNFSTIYKKKMYFKPSLLRWYFNLQ